MRASLVLLATLACVAPAAAQGKTKLPVSVQILEMCEKFAAGDATAIDFATEHGWDAYQENGDDPYVQNFYGSKDVPGLGWSDMYGLIEDYPQTTFGYCRVDVMEPSGDGQALIQAVQNLDRYTGEGEQNGDGSFASLMGVDDPNTLLLASWTPESFVLQLSVIVPKTETQSN